MKGGVNVWIFILPTVLGLSVVFLFDKFYNSKGVSKRGKKGDSVADDVEAVYSETELSKKIGLSDIKNNIVYEHNGNVTAGIRYSTDEFHMLGEDEQTEYENDLISFTLGLSSDIKIIETPKVISGKRSAQHIYDLVKNDGSLTDDYRIELAENILKEKKAVAIEKTIVVSVRNEKDKSKKLQALRDRVAYLYNLNFPVEILKTNDLLELLARQLRKKEIDVESIEKSGGFELYD